MAQGLAVSRLINVSVNLGPVAAQGEDFNSLLMVGDSDVINTKERIRAYNAIEEVADDFGTTAPEYLGAVNFFSQVPQPRQLLIGRWARQNTAALLVGGALSADEMVMSLWTAISNGSFQIVINGAAQSLTGLNFSSASNLNGVASTISAALVGIATVTWDGLRFTVKDALTGSGATIGYATAGVSDTDISERLRFTLAKNAVSIDGLNAETAVQAITVLDDSATSWYALTFAVASLIANEDILAVSAYIEAASNRHIFGMTTAEGAALTSNDNSSIGYLFQVANYNRSFAQYSGSSPYAVASMIGRGVTVNFAGNNTVITFMWKQEPGVVPEFLTASQANALNQNNYNYFAQFNNDTAIIVNGKVGSGAYIDEIWGTDWLANTVQTAVYNLLYTSTTKIPQTDAGTQMIVTAIDQVMAQAVNNGLVAPGVWNQPGFGQLQQGDFLDKGYYIFAPRVATQLQADREARKSVPIQIAAKLAGAIHAVDIIINVNR